MPRAKEAGYSDLITALCLTIKLYDWQIGVAEALDVTVISGAGPGETPLRTLLLLLEENRDKVCLIISPPGELEMDHLSLR